MLVAFLIMLREGLEAALIVGIIASYLQRTGRRGWLPAVWIGIFLAMALALFVGAALLFASAAFPQRQQELFEALVGFLAVGMLSWMVLWMRHTARHLKQHLAAALERSFRSGRHQSWALIGMVLLAVAREGLESIFFLLALFQQSPNPLAPLGALLGLVTAGLVGFGLYRGALRIPLGRFFRFTGLFLLLVAAGLLAGSMRALHEAGLWNHGQQVLFDVSAVLPLDSPLGTLLAGIFGYQPAPTLSEAVVWLGYLALAAWWLRPRSLTASAPPTEPTSKLP
ncbi:iron uptake transporter permease EfeU [Kushneria aurantia]|uniref:Iron uptake transporter permease EfeU n=1 Tax=Kushneria aurantia TaxID=504092 RepID=A0ABV6FZN0_9GAMM|nr:iron uptake transporter permease EfeU [Kushneria aurantia]